MQDNGDVLDRHMIQVEDAMIETELRGERFDARSIATGNDRPQTFFHCKTRDLLPHEAIRAIQQEARLHDCAC